MESSFPLARSQVQTAASPEVQTASPEALALPEVLASPELQTSPEKKVLKKKKKKKPEEEGDGARTTRGAALRKSGGSKAKESARQASPTRLQRVGHEMKPRGLPPGLEGMQIEGEDTHVAEYASEAEVSLRVPGTNYVLSAQLGGSFASAWATVSNMFGFNVRARATRPPAHQPPFR